MSRQRSRLVLCAGVLLLSSFLLAVATANAQDPVPSNEELTIATIEERKALLPDPPAEDDQESQLLREIYDFAIAQLTSRNEWRTRKRQFEAASASAPETLKTIQSEIQALPDKLKLPVTADTELEVAESALEAARADESAAKAKLEELKSEKVTREDLRKQLPEKAATARLKLSSPVEEDLLLPNEADSEVVKEARALATDALRAAQRAEADALDAEVDSYVKRTDLLNARIELADKKYRLAVDLTGRVETLVAGARERNAEKQAEKASEERRKAANAHAVVRAVAEQNEELANRRTGDDGIPSRFNRARERLAESRQKLNEIQLEFEGLQERVEKVGMTDTVGLMLRRRRDALPSPSVYEDRIEQREEELASVQLKLLDVEERRRQLRNIDEVIKERMQKVETSPARREDIQQSLRNQLEAQRGYLDSLHDDYDSYLALLFELDAVDRELVAAIELYGDFVDERVLWIQSAPIISTADFEPGYQAFVWLFNSDSAGAVVSAIVADIGRHPLPFVIALTLIIAILAVQLVVRSRLKRAAVVIESNKAAPYHFTLQALAATALMTLPVPVFFWMAAWRITDAPGTGEYGRAIASGLSDSALVFLGLSFVRHMVRPRGLAEVHFAWNENVRKVLHRHMSWLLILSVIFAFLIATFNSQSDETHVNSAGRFALIVQLLAAAALTHLLLRPNGPVVKQFFERRKSKSPGRKAWFVWGAAIVVPVGIAVLAAAGYAYTAGRLLDRYMLSVLLLLGAVVLNGMLRRWFELSETRIAIRIRKRKKKRKSLSAEASTKLDTDDGIDEVDLVEVRKQTTSLRRSIVVVSIFAGLFLVWLDVLPALGFLDQVELWTHVSTITDAEGNAAETATPVTLGNLLVSLLLVALTFVGARTVPGFLETTILQRLRMSSGIRYAFKSISRYVIAAVGTVIAFQAISIGWSDVQWLVAGFTVGLGFGLQEIFANFVSGLILLIERPVRVGDTVTVNNITGRVTRINMRSTTIEDWDRKELIVPNKAFITTEIINWSLSSDVLRLVLKVGVAYGSDIKAVENTLMEVATAHPRVLKNPSPHTIFQGFGDSSLDFELRVFVTGIDDFRFLRDDLNKSIDAAFRERGIEIAFPQRTLWVRDFKTPLQVTRGSTKNAPEEDPVVRDAPENPPPPDTTS